MFRLIELNVCNKYSLCWNRLDSNVLNEFSKDSFNIPNLSTKKLLVSKEVSSLAVICLM